MLMPPLKDDVAVVVVSFEASAFVAQLNAHIEIETLKSP